MAGGKFSADIEMIFNREFLADFNTILVGGAEEPLYLPADGDHHNHRLFYRDDYFSSALHEISHWCIAGSERRKIVDFGYWYNPDGRTSEQQRQFEAVEVKPQALEWIFSTAAGIPFAVSADNLSSGDEEAQGPSAHFLRALELQVMEYCHQGLPARAGRFAHALQLFYNTASPFDSVHYREYSGR